MRASVLYLGFLNQLNADIRVVKPNGSIVYRELKIWPMFNIILQAVSACDSQQ